MTGNWMCRERKREREREKRGSVSIFINTGHTCVYVVRRPTFKFSRFPFKPKLSQKSID